MWVQVPPPAPKLGCTSQFIIYTTAELFDTTRNNITMHIKNIYAEGELKENLVSKDFLLTANDGKKL